MRDTEGVGVMTDIVGGSWGNDKHRGVGVMTDTNGRGWG